MLSNRIRRLKLVSRVKKICREFCTLGSKSWFCSRQKEVLAAVVPGGRLGRVRLQQRVATNSWEQQPLVFSHWT